MIISKYRPRSGQVFPQISLNQINKNGKTNKRFKTCVLIVTIIFIVCLIITISIVIPITITSSQKNSEIKSTTSSQSTQSNSFNDKSNQIDFLANCSFTPNSVNLNSSCSYGYSGIYCDECGLQFQKPNAKIVGGEQLDWPSIALVVFNYKYYFNSSGSLYLETTQLYCGGTLIDRNTVLTAAHCFITSVTDPDSNEYKIVTNSFYPTIDSMYTVYLGLHNNSGAFDNVSSISPGIKMEIKKFTIHPDYSSDTNLNDIGIITLKNSVTLDCNIQPACLPDPSISNYPLSKNIDAWTAGWGALRARGIAPNGLYNVKLTLYDSTYCRYVSTGLNNWNAQICAGGGDTCQGDSGGPLFVLDKVNNVAKYILVGISSYGDSCELPRIFTKMSAYLTWISSNS